jgi:hypothetical protein
LTATGEKFGVTDKSIQNGLDPQVVCERIIKGVYCRENEMVIGGLEQHVGMFLKRFLPELNLFLLSKYFAPKQIRNYRNGEAQKKQRENANRKQD